MLLQIKLYLLFCSLHLCSFHVLGSAGQSLQQEFYTISGLAEEINRSAFFSLDHVPDHRLRPMIHILFCHLLQFITYCHALVIYKCTRSFSLSQLYGQRWATALCYQRISLTSCCYGFFWGSWCYHVLRSTTIVCSAPCWALCSPTCSRLGSSRSARHQSQHQTHLIHSFTVAFLAKTRFCFCFIMQRLNVKWQVINQRTSVK